MKNLHNIYIVCLFIMEIKNNICLFEIRFGVFFFLFYFVSRVYCTCYTCTLVYYFCIENVFFLFFVLVCLLYLLLFIVCFERLSVLNYSEKNVCFHSLWRFFCFVDNTNKIKLLLLSLLIIIEKNWKVLWLLKSDIYLHDY